MNDNGSSKRDSDGTSNNPNLIFYVAGVGIALMLLVAYFLSTLIQNVLGIGDFQEILDQMDQMGSMDPEMMDQITQVVRDGYSHIYVRRGRSRSTGPTRRGWPE